MNDLLMILKEWVSVKSECVAVGVGGDVGEWVSTVEADSAFLLIASYNQGT